MHSKIDEVDIIKTFYERRLQNQHYGGLEMHKLLNTLYQDKKSNSFKEGFLALGQLYCDSLIDNMGEDLTSNEKSKRKEILNKINSRLENTVFNAYNLNSVNFNEELKHIKPYHNQLILDSNGLKTKIGRHLTGREVEVDLATRYTKKYFDRAFFRKKPDTIVPVMSGGLEPSLLLKRELDIHNFLPIRMSRLEKKESNPIAPKIYLENEIKDLIKRRRVLVVEDINSTGYSMEMVKRFVQDYEPKKIYLTSMCEF